MTMSYPNTKEDSPVLRHVETVMLQSHSMQATSPVGVDCPMQHKKYPKQLKCPTQHGAVFYFFLLDAV